MAARSAVQRDPHQQATQIAEDPAQAARSAGLRYTSDQRPGIARIRDDDRFRYVDAHGAEISSERELARIAALGIPPAWTDVWICPFANGHLQATGRDARGRKQYRYHQEWRKTRDEAKYTRLVDFALALPALRTRVDEDMRQPGLPRTKVLATVVRLLEMTLIRVGNDEYARTNKSYGLTTMRDRHVQIERGTITFSFRGKSGKDHTVSIHDRRLARIVARCRDIPGQELFQYVDEQGQRQTIDSGDVNEYLREVTGEQFSAKDFRTWAGTLLAAQTLRACEPCQNEAQARHQLVQAIQEVASQLGNTPTICRKCYVHPAVLEAYMDGTLQDALQQRNGRVPKGEHGLEDDERALLHFLRLRLDAAA
jgi:DNA topoisomerase-1